MARLLRSSVSFLPLNQWVLIWESIDIARQDKRRNVKQSSKFSDLFSHLICIYDHTILLWKNASHTILSFVRMLIILFLCSFLTAWAIFETSIFGHLRYQVSLCFGIVLCFALMHFSHATSQEPRWQRITTLKVIKSTNRSNLIKDMHRRFLSPMSRKQSKWLTKKLKRSRKMQIV